MAIKKNNTGKKTKVSGAAEETCNNIIISIKDLIKQKTRGNDNIDGVIKSVDENKFTCNVETVNVVYYEVPLKVLISSQASFVEVPKVGSDCTLSFKDKELTRPFLMKADECDKILMKIGTLEFNLSDKFEMIKGSNGLKKTLDGLCDAISQLTVGTALGPSSVPVNVASFQQIKAELALYLK